MEPLPSTPRPPVETGKVTGAVRSLLPALKLPGEADAPLPVIGVTLPEQPPIEDIEVSADSSEPDGAATPASSDPNEAGVEGDMTVPTSDLGEPEPLPADAGSELIPEDPNTGDRSEVLR